MPDDHNSSILR